MDDTRVAAAIEAMIEQLELAHPDYEVEVLLDPGETAGVVNLEALVIHRETEMAARFWESGSDIDGVVARLSRAVHGGLPERAGATPPAADAGARTDQQSDPPQLTGSEEDALDPSPVVEDE